MSCDIDYSPAQTTDTCAPLVCSGSGNCELTLNITTPFGVPVRDTIFVQLPPLATPSGAFKLGYEHGLAFLPVVLTIFIISAVRKIFF